MTRPVCRPTPARRLRVETLEDRTVPSWGGIPPATVAVPTSFTGVTLNGSGDATGTAAITANEVDRKSTRLNSSHSTLSRMPSSA